MRTESAVDELQLLGPADQQIAVRCQRVAPSEQLSTTPHVLMCGGFHSDMQGTKATELAGFCEEQRWHYTRFDYRGHGASNGAPDAFTLDQGLEDTLRVIDQINESVLLIGSSMGGWLATLAALRRPEKVTGLLLVAAAPDFVQELIEPHLSTADQWDLQQGQIVRLENQYARPHPISQALLDSAHTLALLSGTAAATAPVLADLACPVRLVHGTADTDVPYTLSARLMDGIEHANAELTLLHRADHRLSDERSLRVIKDKLCELAAQTGAITTPVEIPVGT